MSVTTITSRAYPKDIPAPTELPKCVCGGEFQLQDIFTKRGELWLTSAVCKDCKEYFCGYNASDMHRAITSGQKARALDNSSYKG